MYDKFKNVLFFYMKMSLKLCDVEDVVSLLKVCCALLLNTYGYIMKNFFVIFIFISSVALIASDTSINRQCIYHTVKDKIKSHVCRRMPIFLLKCLL